MGVLCDSALTLVENIFPPKTEEERVKTFKLAVRDLNSVGLVGVHEASVFPENIQLYKKYSPFLFSTIYLAVTHTSSHTFPLRWCSWLDWPTQEI
jgi:predicted amidohydrolase YtcJ